MTVFKRNVHLGTKDPLIETDDVADKAVTTEKIDNGAITAEKIAKGGVEWENVSDDVQNIIASMEKGGVALSGEFGGSEMIGINQKKLTEVIGPEGTLQGNIDTEAQRAEDAEEALSDRVSDLETAVGEGGSVDERIAVETNRAQAAEELLREYISLSQNQVAPTTAEEWAAMTSWEEGVIYRVAGTTSYTDYMYNGTTTIPMATYNNAIDDVPTSGSDNLVKSGGVQNEIALGAVYDVSAKNPTAGTNSDGKWESLSALLSDANLNTLIPTSVRKGGMSIKFVRGSDNKYVQFHYMLQYENTTAGNAAFVNPDNWQGVDDEPIFNSSNFVKSGGVYDAIVYKQELTADRKSQLSFDSSGVVVSESSSSRVIDYVPCVAGKKYIIDFENIGNFYTNINIAIFNSIPKVGDTIIQDSYVAVQVLRNASGNYIYEAAFDGYMSLSYISTRVRLVIKEIVYVKDKVEEVEEETKANTLELSLQEEKIDNTSESLELFMESEHKAIRMSVNLFDKNSIIDNAKFSSAGRVVSDEEYFISNYIPVTTGQTFIASIDSAGTPLTVNFDNYCVFDENKGFLGYHAYFGGNPTTISEENAKYIACTIKKSISIDKIQIQEGTERTSYEEFGKLYVYDTTPVNTPIKIKADGTGDYTSIRQAFETEGDGKIYEIYPGTYNIADDFTEEEINNASYEPDGSGFCGIKVPNDSKVVGIGNKTEIIVKLELDPNVYSNSSRFSIGTFNLFGNCKIENLTILAVYTRTPIHDDFRGAVNSTHIIRNCILRNEIAMRDVSHGYGLGLRSGETIEMYDCDIYPTMICHSNTGFTKSPKVLMQNCNIYGNLGLSDSNSGVQSFVTLNNCSWGSLSITSSLEVPYLKCYINSGCTNPVFLSGIYDIYGAFVRKYPAKSTINKGQCVFVNITSSSHIPYCSPALTDFDYAIGIALNDAIAEDMVTVFVFNKYILATLCGIEEGDFGDNVSFNNGTLAIGDTNIIGKIVSYQGRKVVKLLK